MNLTYDRQIKEWIQENKEEIIKEWIGICKTPAIKSEVAENAPFGKECAKALRECTDLFKNHGFDTEICEKSGYSLVSFGQGEKTIGIFTHSDVVPVGEDWLYTKPFEPIVKDGALIGRGVEDNKSGIMASLCAMEFFRKYNIPIKSRIQLFIGSNEETGMEDIMAFAKERPNPDISLIPDAEFPCSTGEKGICQFYATSCEKLEEIVDFCGGEAFNIVLDKATATLKLTEPLLTEVTENAKLNNDISVKAEDGKIFILAKGIAKHASTPEGSVNAAHIIAEFLSNITALGENDRKIMKDAAHILSCPFGTSMGIDFCDDLFGRLTFVNGIVKIDGGKLKLSFDMRYSSVLDAEKLIDRTEDAFKKLGWSICVEDNKPGFSIDEGSRIPGLFEEIYKEVTGFEKKSFKLGGGTYARNIKNAFSVGTFTDTKERKTPILKMPPGHGGAHQCDEMIDIESFFAAVRVIIHYLVAMDEEINKI
ncbi:MAG: Sapep family Mn(2+)-dependent dipeptidase [Clostridia bacterium]|nr:Sapep family Mn(2+)-dependent dipeptidase [Clostridia bacterium]